MAYVAALWLIWFPAYVSQGHFFSLILLMCLSLCEYAVFVVFGIGYLIYDYVPLNELFSISSQGVLISISFF